MHHGALTHARPVAGTPTIVRGVTMTSGTGTTRPTVVRFTVAAAVLVLVSAMCTSAGASSRYPCSYGTPGKTVLVDNPPEGRPYFPGTGSTPPTERKYLAMTTTNANGRTGPCECIQPRLWTDGMPDTAVAALRSAMDAKEAEAVANYARFGLPPDAVPLEARTIWLRAAWRSREEQTCLYTKVGPPWAARPGSSIHESGVAVDIEDWGPRTFGQDDRLLRGTGWCRTVAAEPWHYEYRPILESWGRADRCK